MEVNNNAVLVLKEVMQTRKWYGELLEKRKANVYKSLINKNKLSYEKASELLNLLGWQKIVEETWIKK